MNFEKLAGNLGLDKDEYVELIELFIETGTSDIDKLTSALGAGDAKCAAEAIHSIKGASGNMGLAEFYKSAKKIEEKVKTDCLDGIGESVQDLKKKMDAVAEACKT